jgi:hypothetical protein
MLGGSARPRRGHRRARRGDDQEVGRGHVDALAGQPRSARPLSSHAGYATILQHQPTALQRINCFSQWVRV